MQQQPTQSKVKQVHRIDTRGTGDVNLAKYDDHVDKLVDAKAERMESKGSKKQKLTKKSDQRSSRSATSAVRRSRRRCVACSVSSRWQHLRRFR